MNWVDDTITIRKQTIKVQHGEIDQLKLLFFVENPRIYSLVRAGDDEPDQAEIQEKLLSMDYVKSLIQDIKSNGGLIDPVIVKAGTHEVLEGNSRLAAYRWLASKDPIKWGKIKCTLLPGDISETDVFALLGQYHIKGKKDWAPYEQAGFLYRRHKNQGISVTDLGNELGLGRMRIRQLIDTYQFMLNQDERNINKWSYYEEYIKSNKIKKLRDDYVHLDTIIVEKIKSGEINKAVDIRDKLAKLVDVSSKVVAKFVNKEIGLDEAFDLVEASGNNDGTYKRLSNFRQWMVSEDTTEAIVMAQSQALKKIVFELKKIQGESSRLLKKLDV